MGVQMRDRPIVTGKDAKRFLERAHRNKLALSRRILERTMVVGLEKDERTAVYRYIQNLHKGY